MELQQRGLLRLRGLVTEVYPFTEAAKAYERLDRHPEEVNQLVLDFRGAKA